MDADVNAIHALPDAWAKLFFKLEREPEDGINCPLSWAAMVVENVEAEDCRCGVVATARGGIIFIRTLRSEEVREKVRHLLGIDCETEGEDGEA